MFTIVMTVAAMQTKHDEDMLFLYNLIEKYPFFKNSFPSVLPYNPNPFAKLFLFIIILPKTTAKK